ncbi:MAG: nitroreductase family protein, partial [Acidiferrobacterales bacterium]
MDTIRAIKTRHSVKQFPDRPVSRDLVENIPGIARNSPSGANLQPWQVAVVRGKTRDNPSRAIREEA